MTFIKKLKLSIAILISASMTPCFADIFSLKDLNAEQHAANYNSFFNTETADEALHGRADFSDFLSKAEEVIMSYGFDHHTGLRLMHRHFELPTSYVMVEEFQNHEQIPSLVTSAISISEVRSKGATPSGWTFNSSARNVFEFSTDEATHEGMRDIQTTPEFLEAMEKVIKDFHFEDLMSVSVLKKGSLIASEGQYYQERTFPYASVVQVINGDWREGTRTSWPFGKGPMQLACTTCRPAPEGHRTLYHTIK